MTDKQDKELAEEVVRIIRVYPIATQAAAELIPIIRKAKDEEWEEKLAAKSIIYAQAGERAVKAERERIIEELNKTCPHVFTSDHTTYKRDCYLCLELIRKGESNG